MVEIAAGDVKALLAALPDYPDPVPPSGSPAVVMPAERLHLVFDCPDSDDALAGLRQIELPRDSWPARWRAALVRDWPPALAGLYRIELVPGRLLVTVLHRVLPRSRRRWLAGFQDAGAAGSAGPAGNGRLSGNAGCSGAPGHAPAPDVLVVGAGLAGCALADALQRRGLGVTVLEADTMPGGVVRDLPWLAQHPALSPDRRSRLLWQAMRMSAGVAMRRRRAFVRCGRLLPMPAGEAKARTAGFPAGLVQLRSEGLWLPGCHAVDPRAWWAYLAREDGVALRLGVRVQRIEQVASTGRWTAFGEGGEELASAAAIVLANAADAFRLAALPELATGRFEQRRHTAWVGQAAAGARWDAADDGHAVDDATRPALRPIRGSAGPGQPFRIEQPGVCAVVGVDDPAQALRPATGDEAGATAWRWRLLPQRLRLRLRDNLPMAGSVPDMAVINDNRDRFERDARLRLPGLPGLYLLTGLAGRGLLWSIVGAEQIAAAINGEPAPLEPDLADAIAPDRFIVRSLRRTPRGRLAPVSTS